MKNKDSRYDLFSPPEGHEARFSMKLHHRMQSSRPQNLWLRRLTAMGIAASVLLAALFVRWNEFGGGDGLSGQWTQQTAALKQSFIRQWERIEKYDSPESKKIIEDNFRQWEKLQADLEKLQKEFRENNNRAVLNAMLQNLKMQNELLINMHDQLNKIEKQARHEKSVHQS